MSKGVFMRVWNCLRKVPRGERFEACIVTGGEALVGVGLGGMKGTWKERQTKPEGVYMGVGHVYGPLTTRFD